MDFKRSVALMASSMLMVVGVMACSGAKAGAHSTASGTGGSGGSGRKLTIGLVIMQSDEYFAGIESSLKAAAQAQGDTVITVNTNNSTSAEATDVQNLIARKVDAIVMQPISVSSVATMKTVRAAGIPLICYGSCVDQQTSSSVVSGVVQSNNTALGTATGVAAADYIKSSLGGKATIGILNCDVAPVCKLRKAGFKAALAAAGVEANYVADQSGYLADAATPVATNILSAHQNINLMWSANEGGTEAEVAAIKASGKKILVFGTDISVQIAELLTSSDNVLQFTTGQDPKATAQRAFAMAVNAVNHVANSPFEVDVPGSTYARSDQSNVQAYLRANGK